MFNYDWDDCQHLYHCGRDTHRGGLAQGHQGQIQACALWRVGTGMFRHRVKRGSDQPAQEPISRAVHRRHGDRQYRGRGA